jgi:hypothetical protein
MTVSSVGHLQYFRKFYVGVPFGNLREWKRQRFEKWRRG